MSWFKKNKSMEVLKDSYTPMMKLSKDKETGEPDGKYPPRFTFKIKQYDGEVQCKCFKHGEREPMNVSDKSKDDFVLLGIPIPYDQRLSINCQILRRVLTSEKDTRIRNFAGDRPTRRSLLTWRR